MNAKREWLGWGLVLSLFGVGVHLYSQEATPAKPQAEAKAETEEAVLQEKTNALEAQYKFLTAAFQNAQAEQGAVNRANCDWHLALAELAAVRGERQEQIQHLEEAVKFAETEVQIEIARRNAGRGNEVNPAIIHRADVKLALIRAKKRPADR